MDLYNTHKSTIALCNTHNACTHWLTMDSLKAEAYASTKGIKVHHSFEQYSQCLHSLTHHVLTEGSSTYTHKRNKSTIKLFVQYSQCLHPLTHHVLTEGSSICIHKRNQVLHGFVQGWDQASHLGVQVIELTVAIRHKTNHGTQGCTLQKNTATTHTHTCTHTHTHMHTHTQPLQAHVTIKTFTLVLSPVLYWTPAVSSCDIPAYCLTLSLQNILGVLLQRKSQEVWSLHDHHNAYLYKKTIQFYSYPSSSTLKSAWSPQCLFIQKTIQFYSYPSSSTLTRLCSCITLVIWREKGHNSQTISPAPLNKTVSWQKNSETF